MSSAPSTGPDVAQVAVVVMAGGRSRRWGGQDKTALVWRERTVLAHVVEGVFAAVGAEVAVVVAAPATHPARGQVASSAIWVQEQPAGGGPVAALVTALAHLDAPLTALVAGDMPFAATALTRLIPALELTDAQIDGLLGRTPDGSDQLLLAVFRTAALRACLAEIDPADGAGVAMRSVVRRLRVGSLAVSDREAFDLDTPDSWDLLETLAADQG